VDKVAKIVKNISRKIGSPYNVYSKEGVLLGTDYSFVMGIKRSANENIAQFGRSGLFHYQTLLQPGCIVQDAVDTEEKFIVSSRVETKIQGGVLVWQVYLLKINVTGITATRRVLNIIDATQADFNYLETTVYTGIQGFLRKEDWTMETTTPIGREQKGYLDFITPDIYTLIKGDRLTIEENLYIIQEIVTFKKEGYLQIQLGMDVK